MRHCAAWRDLGFIALLIATMVSVPAPGAAADIEGAATVQEDGSLLVHAQTVRLFGIYIPPTPRKCVVFLRPSRCGGRAALALEIKIQGLVFCRKIGENADTSISAVCHVRRTFRSEGDDLAAFLLIHGWALASPDAPFEYVALERIAEARGFGVWGFQVDRLTRR